MVKDSKQVTVVPQTNQWIVVIGGTYAYIIWSTLIRCYPLFYQPLILQFNTNLATVSQISAYLYISCGIAGTLTPVFNKILGIRWTVLILSFLASFAVFVSSLLQSISSIAIFMGIIAGLCMGPILGTFLALVAKYPEKYASVSFQIITLGISIGPLILSPGILILIDTYSWQGALQIFAGFILNLMVAGAPIRPDKIVFSETSATESKNNNEQKGCPIASSESTLSTAKERNFIVNQLVQLNKVLKLEIFLSLQFWLFALIYSGYCLFYYSAVSYIVVYATEDAQLDDLRSATLISGLCAGDAVSKVICGIFFVRIKRNRRLLILSCTHFISAFLFLMLTFASTFESLMVVCVGIGLISGGFIGCHAMTIVTELDKTLFVYVNSYANVIALSLSTIGQIVIATIIDSSGKPSNAFYVGTGCAIFTGVVQLLFHKLIFHKRKRNDSISISLEIIS